MDMQDIDCPRQAPDSTALSCRTTLRHVDPALVQRLALRVHCRKPQHITEVLGISLNTWDKLLCGLPIRASVANRLVARFENIS